MVMGETNYMYISPVPWNICLVYVADPVRDYFVAGDNYSKNSLKMTPTVTLHEYRFPTDASKPATLVIKKIDVTIKSL